MASLPKPVTAASLVPMSSENNMIFLFPHEEVLQSLTLICSEYKKLQMEVDKLNGLQSGLIRIGTFSSVTTY